MTIVRVFCDYGKGMEVDTGHHADGGYTDLSDAIKAAKEALEEPCVMKVELIKLAGA